MRTRRALIAACLLLMALIPFQNCTFTAEGSGQKQAQLASNDGNGQPYDGKPYIVASACADGTVVESRLVLKGAGAILYRYNCETIEPQELGALDLSFDATDPDKLIYSGTTFVTEHPAIPLPGVVSWYYQLQGDLVTRPASIFVIDLFDYDAVMISSLKADGHTVICAVSAGTVESWRPDASSFSSSDLGNQANGAADEHWLDTRSSSVRSIMLERLDLARDKGCHGIDFDNVDGYLNNSGFSLDMSTQLEYNRFLAFAAHDRRLILSLNNVPELASSLSTIFDFAVAEECFRYNECQSYQPFISRQKPVLAIEYTPYSAQQCAEAKAALISLAYFNQALDGTRYDTCTE